MMCRLACLFLIASLPLLSGEPGKTALGAVESLSEPFDFKRFSEELAISPYCGPPKRAVIRNHWETRSQWAQEGEYQFQLLDETTNGNLAGVLIGATSHKNPFGSEVLSLALVRENGAWKVAPVEGSLENTALGFDAAILERARMVEKWMAYERIAEAAELDQRERDKVSERLSRAVPEKELNESDPRQVLQKFVAAVQAGDAEAAIVWQGFLEQDKFTEVNWEEELLVTRLGVRNEDQRNVWRLLTSEKVMRVIIVDQSELEEDSCECLLCCLCPFETDTMRSNLIPVRFRLARVGTGWRVRLPVFFSLANRDGVTFSQARSQSQNWEDRQKVYEMFQIFESEHEEIRTDEVEAMLEGLKDDLETGGFEAFLCRQFRFAKKVEEEEEEGDDDDIVLPRARVRFRPQANEEDKKRLPIYEAAVNWWSLALDERDLVKAEVAKIFRKDDIVLAMMSLPQTSDSWEPRYLEVWLGKNDGKWMILPGKDRPLRQSYPEDQQKAVTAMMAEIAKYREETLKEFLRDSLKSVALAAEEGQAATAAEASAVVKGWRETARSGGMMALLEVSAVRELPEDPRPLLKTLGYVRAGAAAGGEPDEILGTHAAGRFRGVFLKIDPGRGRDLKWPLLIVVPTEEGYRVLVDLELPLATNKGIELLNEERLEELALAMSEDDLARIKELSAKHQAIAKPLWEKWEQEKEALAE